MTDPDPPTQPERPAAAPEPPAPEPPQPERPRPEPAKPSTLKAALPPPGMPRPAPPLNESHRADPAPPAATPQPAVTPSHSPRHALPIFTAIGFLALAAGMFYLWQESRHEDQLPVDPARIASLEGQTRDLRQRLASFETRLIALEQRPVTGGSASVDLRPLEARLGALETRPATVTVAAPAVDLGPLEARLAAAERIARAQAAGLALDAGQPLGALANAPPALARFATSAPPTLATLRASFPEIARRARAASQPGIAPTWSERITQSLAGLVTIRRGNDVLVGAASSVVLAAAQDRLDAGDIAGAVAALDALDPAAAAVAAGWKSDAQAVLAARAALATMARP